MKNFTEFMQDLEEIYFGHLGLGKKKKASKKIKKTTESNDDTAEKAKLQRLMSKASSPRGLKPEEKQELNRLKGKFKDYLAKKQQRSQKTAQRTMQ